MQEDNPRMTLSPVTIQTTPESQPSTPSWMGEVAAFAQVLPQAEILKAIQNQVRFARARFGHYDLIDFVIVLIGYGLSAEPTLQAFYERVTPFAEPFMALFGRTQLPHRSTLSRFLAALDQPTVEALRTLCARRSAFPQAICFSRWSLRSDREAVDRRRCRWNPPGCSQTCASTVGSLTCSTSSVRSGLRTGLLVNDPKSEQGEPGTWRNRLTSGILFLRVVNTVCPWQIHL
jgi:hypothetical protein